MGVRSSEEGKHKNVIEDSNKLMNDVNQNTNRLKKMILHSMSSRLIREQVPYRGIGNSNH